MHSDPTAGHFYKEATIEKTKKRYYWPSMYLDIIQGNKYIAVAMNYLTKWSEAKAIQRTDAESIADVTNDYLESQIK
ncbi:hypothetical protein G9A89_007044 [Geosiphon pyriformis]|nr:hypothetical protein G9A89_007044 [Geosiphon pyriformis]